MLTHRIHRNLPNTRVGLWRTGILDILKAYHECGYEGYIRPDHGRHLWGEGPGTVRPGYGLYDRALGIMYMLGAWDMLDKKAGTKTTL